MRNISRQGRLGALLITIILLASACGQKGDLYHPERGQQQYTQSSPGR